MKKFELNKKYDHKKDYVAEALGISEDKSNLMSEKIWKYFEKVPVKEYKLSMILDFVEQQDWSLVEKLYATQTFTFECDEAYNFGDYNEEMIEYIISQWKKNGSVTDDNDTRDCLKHIFVLLSKYRPECLVKTIEDVNNLAEKFEKTNSEGKKQLYMTSEQIEKQRVEILMNNALQNIDKAIPDTFGVVVFGKTGYDIISKSPEMTKLIQETLKAGQKNFIAEKDSNMSFYQ